MTFTIALILKMNWNNWIPQVTNYESLDEMPYSRPPETEFQKYIRSTKHGKMLFILVLCTDMN